MNKSTEKKTVLDHIDLSDYPKELKNEISEDIDYRGSLLVGIQIILIFFTSLILLILNIKYPVIFFRYIYPVFFIFGLFFYILFLIFVLIPQILIFTKITLRTKSTIFAREWLINFQVLVLIGIGLISFFPFSEDYSYGRNWLIVIFNFGIFFLFIQRKSVKRKPLFRDVKMNISQTPIVSVHSIEIKEELDGYSQRPISSDFQLLRRLIRSSSDFKKQLDNFCTFLGKKGELIDWYIEESYAILYPRFAIKFPNLRKNPLFFYHTLRRVRFNEEQTSIELTLFPPQISININFEDYETLNREPTFHTLCLNVLESVKESLIAFLNNDLEAAYNILTRGREIEPPFIQDIVVFNIFSSSHAFLSKIYTNVLKRKKKEI